MSKKPMAYEGLFEQRQAERAEEPTTTQEVVASEQRPTERKRAAKKPQSLPKTGKKDNPDYQQATAYIPRQLHQDVKVLLIQEGGKQDFSELVEELLRKWVKGQQRS